MSTGKTHKGSLLGSVSVVSGSTAFSRVLGLIREQVMAYFFGASLATDAFVTAFRIPNLLRDMFAEGALSSAFVPIFKDQLVRENEEEAFSLARTVATAVLVVVGLLVLIGIIAAPIIIYVSANGFVADQFKFDLTVSLTRWMMVYLLLVSLSALVMGMLNSFGRFGIPALSPAVFNLGMIVSMVFLREVFEWPVYSLAIGVLLGGLGQLAIQLPLLIKLGFRFRPRFDFLDERFKRVLRLFVPMILGMSAGRINILLNTLLASFLIEGALSYLNYSYRLMHFPLGVFAVALGTVALPRASELAARGDMKEMADVCERTLKLNMYVILPAAAGLAFLGVRLVDLIYQWGAFDTTAASNTSLALLHYSYGLVGFAAVRVLTPFYYAVGDARLPMRISFATVGLNMALYWPLIKVLDFAGLAAATSIAGIANAALLMYFLPGRKVPIRIGHLMLDFLRSALAATVSVLVARLIPSFLTGNSAVVQRIIDLGQAAVITVVLYVLITLLLGSGEIKRVWERLIRRGGKSTEDGA